MKVSSRYWAWVLCAVLGWGQLSFAGTDALLAARAQSAASQSRLYAKALTSILGKHAFFASGLDSYIEVTSKHDPMMDRLKREVDKARDNVNAGRAAAVSAEEIMRLQTAYHQAKTRQLKQVLGAVESDLYSSNSYLMKEWLDGALVTTGKIVDDYLDNWHNILEPLMFADLGGVFKNLVTQMVDSTYKVTFVDHAKGHYGATEAIAQYWWKSYFSDPVNKSNEQKLAEGLIGKGLEEVKGKLKMEIMEGVKLGLISKTQRVSEEVMKEQVESYAGKVVKKWVETPALLAEIAMKYYLVGDAHLLFAETAPNEIRRIKQIRELVGSNEADINRCYFYKWYFLLVYKQKLSDWPAIPETTQAKPSEPQEITVVTLMKQAVPQADPYTELEELVAVDKAIEKDLAEMDVEQPDPPEIGPVINRLADLWKLLREDAIEIEGYFSMRTSVLDGYLRVLEQWEKQAKQTLADARLPRDEQQEREKEIDEAVAERLERLAAESGEADTELRKGRAEFAKVLQRVYGLFNGPASVRTFKDAYWDQYRSFCNAMANTIGGVYNQEPLRSTLETYAWLFSRPAKPYERALKSDQPSVYVLKVGPRLVHGLDALQKGEWNAIQSLYLKGLKQQEAWETLFSESPQWTYGPSETLMDHGTQNRVRAWIDTYEKQLRPAFREISRVYVDSGKAALRIADLNRRTILKVEESRQSLRIALSAEKARADLLFQLVKDSSDLAVQLPNAHRDLRADVSRHQYTVLKDLFATKLSPAEAREALSQLALKRKQAEETEDAWRDLRATVSTMSEHIKPLAREGIGSIQRNREALLKTQDAHLVEENDQLQRKADAVLNTYRDSTFPASPIDLTAGFYRYAKEHIDFIVLTAYSQTGSLILNERQSDFAALRYGNAEPALNLVRKFEDFQAKASKADEAKAAATKVHLAGLAAVAQKVDALGNRPVTQAEKDALMAEIHANDEKTVKVYNSYGHNWRFWNSNEESELVLRIRRLPSAVTGVAAARKTANDWLRPRLDAYEKELSETTFPSAKAYAAFANRRWTLEGKASDLFKKTASESDRSHGHKYDQDIQARLARIHTLLMQKRPK